MPSLSVTSIAVTKIVMDLGRSQRVRGAFNRLSSAISSFSNDVINTTTNDHNNESQNTNTTRSTSSSHQQASSSLLMTNKGNPELIGSHPQQSKTPSQLEYIWERLQILLLWDNVLHSVVAINIINFLFYIARGWAPRFYSSIMLIMFFHNFSKLWFCYIWPEIRVTPAEDHDVDRWTYLNPHLLTLPEFMSYLTTFVSAIGRRLNSLVELRRNKPGVFCALVCTTLAIVAYVGDLTRGINIVYFIVLGVYVAPGIYIYLLPENMQEVIHNYILSITARTQHATIIDQDYMVESQNENISKDQPLKPSHDTSEFEQSSDIYPQPVEISSSKLISHDHSSPIDLSDQYTKGASTTEKTLNWIKTGMDVPRNFFDGSNKSGKCFYMDDPTIMKQVMVDDLPAARTSSSSSDDDEFEIISEVELQMVPKTDEDINMMSSHLRHRLNSTISGQSASSSLK